MTEAKGDRTISKVVKTMAVLRKAGDINKDDRNSIDHRNRAPGPTTRG